VKEYIEIIVRRSAGYEGPHQEMIESLPDLYYTVNRLISRETLPQRQRVFAMAVIGYFSIHDDVLSVHDLGAEGYLDDAYVCCHVLRHFVDVLGAEDLYDHWRGKHDLLALLKEPFERLAEDLDDRGEAALRFAGLSAYTLGGSSE
jgi:uncharacterized membrane protein YkvA (DUF1232 family)